MIKKVRTDELYDCKTLYLRKLFETSVYPWDILSGINSYAEKLADSGLDGFRKIADGVLVGEDVVVHDNVTIIPPAIIGKGTEIRPGAYIRGGVITGENCVIGNSSELKNCILLDNVQIPHYNYVGDSILGNKAHLGAGAICSNFKAGGSNVVIHGDTDYPTGLRKVGAMLADGADIGCGCVMNPGTVVGKHTSVYPLTSLRGVYPEGCIVKSADNIIKRM